MMVSVLCKSTISLFRGGAQKEQRRLILITSANSKSTLGVSGLEVSSLESGSRSLEVSSEPQALGLEVSSEPGARSLEVSSEPQARGLPEIGA